MAKPSSGARSLYWAEKGNILFMQSTHKLNFLVIFFELVKLKDHCYLIIPCRVFIATAFMRPGNWLYYLMVALVKGRQIYKTSDIVRKDERACPCLTILVFKKVYIYTGGISQDVNRLKMWDFYPLFFRFSWPFTFLLLLWKLPCILSR